MRQITDDVKWAEAYFDMPFAPNPERVKAAKQPDDILDVEGVHLKSRETGPTFPKHFGKLAKYTEDEVIVVSKPPEPKCIWVGTASEYRAMWRVD